MYWVLCVSFYNNGILLLIDSHISNLYTMKRIRNLSLRVTSSLYFHGLVIIKIK